MTKMQGRRFTELVVVSFAEKRKWADFWNVVCSCGTCKVVRGADLRNGHTKSCGHLRRDVTTAMKTTHGMRYTPEYKAWSGMLQRCTNPNDSRFADWGGRGITVCSRWLRSFETFFADMGKRPKGKSLDRIDNNKNYKPSNCHWATPKEQSQNRRPRSKKKTHCIRGHEFTPENTYTYHNVRGCKACRKSACRKYRKTKGTEVVIQ